jgi:hypothetical protein
MWVTISAVADVTVLVNIDGVDQTPIVIPHTSGVMLTRYLSFFAVKGKLFSYRLTSPSPFQLFETESWVMIGKWSRDEGTLLETNPFGMKSSVGRESAATI